MEWNGVGLVDDAKVWRIREIKVGKRGKEGMKLYEVHGLSFFVSTF